MKASKTLLESLEHMEGVRTGGDLCQIISNAMLALVRKEISATDLEALAKGGDTVANVLNAQCKIAKMQVELREKGVDLGKVKQIGQMLIGSGESDATP